MEEKKNMILCSHGREQSGRERKKNKKYKITIR